MLAICRGQVGYCSGAASHSYLFVQTQRAFGNKWNDIAAYLPMRCNNDIKNYFNLYLKDKNGVFSENCYLRSGYDLTQLLQAEPDDVAQRRQKLEADKVRIKYTHVFGSHFQCTTS